MLIDRMSVVSKTCLAETRTNNSGRYTLVSLIYLGWTYQSYTSLNSRLSYCICICPVAETVKFNIDYYYVKTGSCLDDSQ